MLCYSGFSIDSIQNNLLLPHKSYNDQLYAYLLDEEYDTDAIRDDVENGFENDDLNSNIYTVFNNQGIFKLIYCRVLHSSAFNPYAFLRVEIPHLSCTKRLYSVLSDCCTARIERYLLAQAPRGICNMFSHYNEELFILLCCLIK